MPQIKLLRRAELARTEAKKQSKALSQNRAQADIVAGRSKFLLNDMDMDRPLPIRSKPKVRK